MILFYMLEAELCQPCAEMLRGRKDRAYLSENQKSVRSKRRKTSSGTLKGRSGFWRPEVDCEKIDENW